MPTIATLLMLCAACTTLPSPFRQLQWWRVWILLFLLLFTYFIIFIIIIDSVSFSNYLHFAFLFVNILVFFAPAYAYTL